MSNPIIVENPQEVIEHLKHIKRILESLGEWETYYKDAVVDLESFLKDTEKQVDLELAECQKNLEQCYKYQREYGQVPDDMETVKKNLEQCQQKKKKLEQCSAEFGNFYSDLRQFQTICEQLNSDNGVLSGRVETLMRNLLEIM